MRREKEAGGHGTKVILNLPLNKLVKLFRQSSNILRVTCIETQAISDSEDSVKEHSITSYLLKTKSAQVVIYNRFELIYIRQVMVCVFY